MKIVCDACQAKYSISDDKVQGKVFKIRCKKCSNIIVVRGGAGAGPGAEPAPAPAQEKDTRVYDYGYDGGGDQPPAGDDAVWHVVINQDQVGPMTAVEVQQRYSAGELDAETYAWREGFADWLPLAQVDTFAAFVAGGATMVGGSSSGADAVAAMFGSAGGEGPGTARSDPADLFAAASASASSHQADDDGGDLFGSKPAAAAAQASQQPANSKLRGERNENSVLFSLNNLAQLASDKPAAPTAPSSTMQGHGSGAAGGEGSGLIDIRSMANAYLGGNAGAAKPATSSAIGSIDDLPVFGGGGFSEPAVIVPSAATASASSGLMIALIGSVSLLAVAAVVLVIVLVTGKGDKDKEPELAAVKPRTEDPARGKPEDVKSPEDVKKPDDVKRPEDVKKPEDAKSEDAVKPDDAKKPEDQPKKPDVVKKPVKPPVVAAKDPKKDPPKKDPPVPTKKDPPKDAAGSCDEVSCVLNNYEGACCLPFKKGGKTTVKPPVQIGEKPKGDVAESLDRGMISAGGAAIKARAIGCGAASSKKGTVKVSVKVNPDGSVASVTVKESPDPALGNCVAGAMQRARFQKTVSGGSFGYPFVFN